MTEIITYTQCTTCKTRIQSEWIQFHNCADEEKIKEIELQIQAVLDENSKLKIQNLELKKSVESIKKEIQASFGQMKDIVGNYLKKFEAKKKSEEVKTVS